VSPTLLVLQHIACEPPAAFEDELRARGLDLARVELDEGEPLPDWREFVATVVMGGPMGAYEEDAYPWLVEEKRQIGEAAQAGHPIWGVCLGAQLLAGALGARVYPGHEAEVGLLPVELTAAAAEDPVFGDARAASRRFSGTATASICPTAQRSWRAHRPIPIRPFASSVRTGFNFHLEGTPELAARWGGVPAYAESLERIRGAGALDRLVGEVGVHADSTTPLARGLFGRWLERVARVPARVIG
jgi:GMP synthase (glutamine-hydrolysing)